MEAPKHTIRPCRQDLLQSGRGRKASQDLQNARVLRPVGGTGSVAVELRQ